MSQSGLQNQSEMLKKNVQKINYPYPLSFKVFQDENPMIFLQILHHAVLSYNVNFYKDLIEKGYELFSKSDLKFMESIYRFLLVENNYKPSISLKHFFSNIYLEQKLILSNQIIEIILLKHPDKVSKHLPILNQFNQQKQISNQSVTENTNRLKDNLHPFPEVKMTKRTHNSTEEVKQNKNNSHIYLGIGRGQEEDEEDDTIYKQEDTIYKEEVNQNPQQTSQNKGQRIPEQKWITQTVEHLQNNIETVKTEVLNVHECQQQMYKKQQNIEQTAQLVGHSCQNILDNQQFSYKNTQRDESTKEQTEIKTNKLDRPVTVRELNEVMKLLVNMNSTIQETIHKFDHYQTQVNMKLQNIDASIMLLDGEVKLLKAISKSE